MRFLGGITGVRRKMYRVDYKVGKKRGVHFLLAYDMTEAERNAEREVQLEFPNKVVKIIDVSSTR